MVMVAVAAVVGVELDLVTQFVVLAPGNLRKDDQKIQGYPGQLSEDLSQTQSEKRVVGV